MIWLEYVWLERLSKLNVLSKFSKNSVFYKKTTANNTYNLPAGPPSEVSYTGKAGGDFLEGNPHLFINLGSWRKSPVMPTRRLALYADGVQRIMAKPLRTIKYKYDEKI